MRLLRMILTLLLSLSMTAAFAVTAHIPAPQTKTTHKKLASFSRIDASGAMHVLVDQVGSLKHSVATVHTTSAHPVKLTVKDHTLYLSTTNEPLKFQPFVHLRIKQLNHLIVNNHVSAVISHTNSKNLHVVANNFSRVKLVGLVDVSKIQQNDQSKVSVQWVDSDSLTVNVKNKARLTLAGATNKLIANAADSAQVKAEYLRANNAWVKAGDQSAIYLTPVDSMSAFASNKGNVYYYKYPKLLNRNTTQSGNVLQVAWHN